MEITHCLPQKFHLKTLVIFYIFLSYYSANGELEIHMIESPIKGMQGQNMTLPCLFYGYGASPLDVAKVAVRWDLRTWEGEEKQVYLFNGGKHIQTRPGSYIPANGIMRGDGSLYIPNIQFSDDGEYTCNVYLTPDKAISKVTMEVSAKPTCTLRYSKLDMNPHTERSVTCYVNGFYPKPVTIHWVKYSKASSNNSELDSQTCTSIPVQNRDETYNMTSLLTVRPMSTDENGDVYSCVIIHRSRKDAVTLNISLSVLPIHGDRKDIPIIVCMVLLFVFLALSVALCYCLVKVSPDVSEISSKDLIHMEESVLKCHICGFRPNNLNLQLYWKNGEENILIESWSSREPRERSQENGDEQGIQLIPKADPAGPILEPVITPYKWFLFRCVCAIRITPRFNIHNGKMLALEVHHAALKSPISKMQILKVNSPAKIEPIETNQESYNIGDQLELTCKIHSFYPKSIQVFWYKDTEEILQLNNEAQVNGNGLYYVVSRLRITVTEEDFKKIFRCKAKHEYNTTEAVQWKLERQQAEPILEPIVAIQGSYRVGDRLELECKIHSYYPLNIKVTWCKENEKIPSELTDHEDGVITRMSYIVTEEDFGKTFTCKVEHPKKHNSAQWKLEKQTEIQSPSEVSDG